jgi:hypothetical protein
LRCRGLLKLFEMQRSENNSERVFDLMGPPRSLWIVSCPGLIFSSFAAFEITASARVPVSCK